MKVSCFLLYLSITAYINWLFIVSTVTSLAAMPAYRMTFACVGRYPRLPRRTDAPRAAGRVAVDARILLFIRRDWRKYPCFRHSSLMLELLNRFYRIYLQKINTTKNFSGKFHAIQVFIFHFVCCFAYSL